MKTITQYKTIGLMLLALFFSLNPAYASSSESWKKNNQNLKTACFKASQLKSPKIASDIMLFDDRVGYSAVVLEGHYPQAHMKNRLGRELCLWHRAKQKAFITEADSLIKK